MKKDELMKKIKSLELSKIEMRSVGGGIKATACGGGFVETAGSPNTWVDTPGDCGADPDGCDGLAIRKSLELSIANVSL